ncbi:MAG: FAD-dependent oxidoreductase, partial [bacterium]
MSELNSKLVVIGGGPGGYAAAFLAADLGMNVTLVEIEENPGGVCLYRGCIPSKALLHVAKLLREAEHAENWGVHFGKPKIELDKLRGWKNSVVQKMTGGLGQLSKARKINYLHGRAEFIDSKSLKITKNEGGEETLQFEHAILATGSRPAVIPNLQLKSARIMDSTAALDIASIPKTLLVIGGGYIGLELGSVYSSLGTQVTVVEMLPSLLPGADKDLIAVLTKQIKAAMHAVYTKTKVMSMQEVKNGVKVAFEGGNVEQKEQTFEKVLISVGRTPNT